MRGLVLSIVLAVGAMGAALPAGTAAAQVAAWQTVTDSEIGYSISLPGKPSVERQTRGEGPNAVQTIAYSYFTETTGFGIEAGRVTFWPAGEEKERIAFMIDGMLGDQRLLSRKPMVVPGGFGEELELMTTISGKDSRFRVQVIYQRQRVFTLLATWPDGQPDTDAARFLNSLKLD
jgi:hypothetical protein